MPDHLRALVIILILAPLTFAVARTVTVPLIADADFVRRRNLWIALTLVAYLAHNFWICILLAGVLLWYATAREHNRIALYFFVLFALPALPDAIPGLGVINYFFSIDYLRLLSLAVLAPAALELHRDRDSLPVGRGACDKLLLAYVAYNLVLIFLAGTFTNFLRSVFLNTIDILLPYYVASRALRRPEQFRDALASFVVGAGLLAGIGIFEAAKGWLIYAPLKESLDNHYPMMNGLRRGETQRAMASTGQPIAFGYVMAVAIGLWLYLQQLTKPRVRLLPLLLLIAALIATLSRGPWVGAAIVGVVFILAGPRALQRLLRLCLFGGVAVGLATLTPVGENLIDLLPFIGDSEGETVGYRQQLIEFFVPIILDNPFNGASDYLYSAALEGLRQGEGIIDVVNSFIGIGLHSGLVGLVLFTGFFVSVGRGVWRTLRREAGHDADTQRLGQALLAVLIGIMVIIGTVSSITVIPYIYWTIAGIGVAYIGSAADARNLALAVQAKPRPLADLASKRRHIHARPAHAEPL
jgi:O-antigen ligase